MHQIVCCRAPTGPAEGTVLLLRERREGVRKRGREGEGLGEEGRKGEGKCYAPPVENF